MSKEIPKKKTSFSLSEEVVTLLAKLAEDDSRSSASMLEALVKDAALRKGINGDFVPTEAELTEIGFRRSSESSERISRYENARPCPGGQETLVIEISRGGSVFLTRLAKQREEKWGGWRLPSRRFFYEMLDSLNWL